MADPQMILWKDAFNWWKSLTENTKRIIKGGFNGRVLNDDEIIALYKRKEGIGEAIRNNNFARDLSLEEQDKIACFLRRNNTVKDNFILMTNNPEVNEAYDRMKHPSKYKNEHKVIDKW